MSLPVAAEFVQISLILFMTSLLSPLGAGNMIFNTTTVCTTKSGNNTHISYNVSGYNETKLVLSCTGEAGRTLLWTRVDGRVLCASRNCTINSDRRLTNDDSGDYVCKVSVANGTEFQFIHINVLAPPKLTTKLTECHGDNNDKCTIRQNTDFFMWSTYNITVSYDGNGPFHVEWHHNSTKFMCSDFKFCQMENGTTYQKLQLQSTSLTEAETMPGLYSAIVSNSYGTNESMIRIQRSCVPKGLPHPKPEIVVDLQEGSTLNDSCSIEIQPGSLMYACITKNLSATFDDLKDDLGYGGCSVCNGANDFGHQCTCQFNSSITDITVSRSDDGGCPAKQIMNFMKNDVTVEDDNGTKIICAYTTIDEVIPYTSIYVKVSRPPNNHSSQVRATVSSTVVCFIVVLGILALAIVSYVVLRKKKRQHSGVRDGFIQASGPPDPERPDSDYAEHQPLLNTRQGDVDLYGSVIEDFPGVLGSDEPSENVTIHASNQ